MATSFSNVADLWKRNRVAALQFLRYGVVGLTANTAGYASYLLITWLGVGHKTAMTVVYVFAITAAYLGNKTLTFAHRGDMYGTYVRYWLLYLGCYVFNWSAMYILVDLLGYRHQLVQLALIFLDAPVLFLLQKFWVFRDRRPAAPA